MSAFEQLREEGLLTEEVRAVIYDLEHGLAVPQARVLLALAALAAVALEQARIHTHEPLPGEVDAYMREQAALFDRKEP